MAKRAGSRERRRILWDYVFLTPQLVIYLVMTILPLFIALPMLFTDRLSYTDVDWQFVGLDNFTAVLTDVTLRTTYLDALSRTVTFTILHYLVVMVVGLAMALLMYEVGFRGGVFTIIYMPYMLSGLAIGFIAVMLFSETTGTVNLILLNLGWIDTPINIKDPAGTTVILPILVGWRNIGFYLAIFLAGLFSIPTETIEAAIVDGTNYWQRLIFVYFPQMASSFIVATVFAILNAFNVFDELVALGGLYQNKAAEFLSIVIFNYGFGSNRFALGMTLATITFVPLIILTMVLQRLQRKLRYD